MNDWAELGRITQVSGSRTYCLKGRLAMLEQALMLWAQQRLAADGFTLMTVPAIARPQAFVATGHFPGHEEEAYEIPKDELYLAGTGEIALTSLHSGEILEAGAAADPLCGLLPCFRREAGSAGRDVRGLPASPPILQARTICDLPRRSGGELELACAPARHRRGAASGLEIPYQVIETSTGDMGLGKFRMNDIESWVPSLGKYRETHSCSTLLDWQARRANLRWRDEDRRVRFAHTLNNTALASRASRAAARKPPGSGRAGPAAQGAAGADGGRVSLTRRRSAARLVKVRDGRLAPRALLPRLRPARAARAGRRARS
jgi:seryl-tRNA synthetase